MLAQTATNFDPSPLSIKSPASTLIDDHVRRRYSTTRRYALLTVLCLAHFVKAIDIAALIAAIPAMVESLEMTVGESTWIVSAFQLTYAPLLLISGRISDVYSPKLAFVGSVASFGVFSIGIGFVRSKIPLLILRALSGIGFSMSIPSALALIVTLFPGKTEQAVAIGVFGGCAAIGTVVGLVIGAVLVQFASWSWVFWFIGFISVPIAVVGAIVIPQSVRLNQITTRCDARWRSLDLIGTSILTVTLTLLIFAVRYSTTAGWRSATILVPLILAGFMALSFFYFETTIPTERAAIPPRTWFRPNFLVLFFTALLPFFFFATILTTCTLLWQSVWHWSAISTAIHLIPIGVAGIATTSLTSSLTRAINPRWTILFGESLCMIATILFQFSDSPARYWPFIFPGLILGSAGATLVYMHTNIAILRTSPSSMAGTVGAIFNSALELGSAVGLSVISSIEYSVEAAHGGFRSYVGRKAAYWFLLAVIVTEFVGMLLFYRIAEERATEAVDDMQSGKLEGEVGDIVTEKHVNLAAGEGDAVGTLSPTGTEGQPHFDANGLAEEYATLTASKMSHKGNGNV